MDEEDTRIVLERLEKDLNNYYDHAVVNKGRTLYAQPEEKL